MDLMLENPGESIPRSSGHWSDCKALYRLLDQENLTDKTVIDAHCQGTLRRAQQAAPRTLLAIQDTTTLNFSSHEKLEGQGPIGSGKSGTAATGLHLHNTLLVDGDGGESPGLLGAKLYAREESKRARQPPGTRNREPIESKESYRWPESFEIAKRCHQQLGQRAREANKESGGPRVISVCDREADTYGLLVEAQQHRAVGLHLLVRSQHNRRQVTDGDGASQQLWETLAEQKEMGRVEMEVPRKGGMKKRQATLAIRCGEIGLGVPAHKRKYLKMDTTVKVHATELLEVVVFPQESGHEMRSVFSLG